MPLKFVSPAVQSRQLKYASHVAAASPCPPPGAIECDRAVFRWVWNPVTSESFTPVPLMPNKRVNSKKGKPHSCAQMGLSMFETETQARTRFDAFREGHPLVHLTLGTHVAAVGLLASQGRQGLTDGNGHFNFWEYAGVDLVPCSHIVGGPLP